MTTDCGLVLEVNVLVTVCTVRRVVKPISFHPVIHRCIVSIACSVAVLVLFSGVVEHGL